jgi:hypothetical protein
VQIKIDVKKKNGESVLGGLSPRDHARRQINPGTQPCSNDKLPRNAVKALFLVPLNRSFYLVLIDYTKSRPIAENDFATCFSNASVPGGDEVILEELPCRARHPS